MSKLRNRVQVLALIAIFPTLSNCADQPSDSELEALINTQIAGISCVQVKWPPSVRAPRPTDITGPYRLLKLAVNDSNLVQDMYRAGILDIEKNSGSSAHVTFRIAPEHTGYFQDDRFSQEYSSFRQQGLNVCAQDERVTEITTVTSFDEGDLPTLNVEFAWQPEISVPSDWTFFPGIQNSMYGTGYATLHKPGDQWVITTVTRGM